MLDDADLIDMGISNDKDRLAIIEAAGQLNKRVDKCRSIAGLSVDDWLKSVHLENYIEVFRKHLYTDMERVRNIWEVELAAVLEIQKPAHRKRILAPFSGASSRPPTRNGTGPNLDDINKDLNTLVSSVYFLFNASRSLMCAFHAALRSRTAYFFLSS